VGTLDRSLTFNAARVALRPHRSSSCRWGCGTSGPRIAILVNLFDTAIVAEQRYRNFSSRPRFSRISRMRIPPLRGRSRVSSVEKRYIRDIDSFLDLRPRSAGCWNIINPESASVTEPRRPAVGIKMTSERRDGRMNGWTGGRTNACPPFEWQDRTKRSTGTDASSFARRSIWKFLQFQDIGPTRVHRSCTRVRVHRADASLATMHAKDGEVCMERLSRRGDRCALSHQKDAIAPREDEEGGRESGKVQER